MELTPNEVKLITALRTLHAYENLSVSADKQGNPDSYLVTRTYKELWIKDIDG